MPDTPTDDTASVHAYAALKPDGHIDPDSVRATVEDACQDAPTEPVVEVEVSVPKKYTALIAQMRQRQVELLRLWSGPATGRVRVVRHSAGQAEADVTQEHADAIRNAGDALHKAIVLLESLDA